MFGRNFCFTISVRFTVTASTKFPLVPSILPLVFGTLLRRPQISPHSVYFPRVFRSTTTLPSSFERLPRRVVRRPFSSPRTVPRAPTGPVVGSRPPPPTARDPDSVRRHPASGMGGRPTGGPKVGERGAGRRALRARRRVRDLGRRGDPPLRRVDVCATSESSKTSFQFPPKPPNPLSSVPALFSFTVYKDFTVGAVVSNISWTTNDRFVIFL